MSFFNISPNTIIYNSANTPYTLRKGAFCIGINDIGYGSIGLTNFWNGITPPSFTTEAVVSSSTSANGLFLGSASALSMVQIGWYANGPEVPNGIVTEITIDGADITISIVPANIQMQFQSGESYTFTTNVPTGQTYTIYNTSEGTSEPSIRVANNYNQAVQQFTNLGMPNGTTDPFVWAAENNNILVINFNYPDIQIPNGDTLVMHLDSSYIASLPLPEAINPIPSGIKWYDVSWEPNNSVDFVIGEGGAVSFDGSAIIFDGNSYASVIEEASIPIGNSQYTINVWFNPSDFTGENAFVGWGNYGTTNEVNAFRLINNTGLVNYWWDVDLSVTYSFTTDTWYNATCSFDGTTRKIYVNGVLLGSDEPAGHNVPDATNLTVGYAGIGSESFIGSMQVLSIYNTALTDAQVLSSYQAMLPRFTINPTTTTTTTTSTTSTTTTIAAPTATTDGYANLTPNTAQITGTIVSNGGSTITERGIVYSISPNPTIANNKVSDGAGNPDALGQFIHTYTILGTNGNTCYVKIYATNAVGTSYGSQISFSLPCFIKGTKITLASGIKKNIEDISYEDSLLVWNFDEGRFDSANPIWIMTPVLTQYVNIIFSDGSKLGISGHLNHDGGHRIFNLDKGEFTYAIPNEHSPIGTRTFNDKGDIVTIVGKEESSELEEIYNVVTNYHLNIFAEGILTSRRLNNLYPIADMKFIKDERSITSIEEFKGVPTEYYEGLRLGEQPLASTSEGFLVKTPGELAYTLPTISELAQWTIEFINKRL